MKIFLDKEKVTEILRLYYSDKTKMQCNVVIETSVKY